MRLIQLIQLSELSELSELIQLRGRVIMGSSILAGLCGPGRPGSFDGPFLSDLPAVQDQIWRPGSL